MADLDDAFAKLLGRQPSDAERQRLFRVRDALGLRNNDALWLVLIALEHYQEQYERFPATISKACADVVAQATSAATTAGKNAGDDVKRELARAVAKAATAATQGTTRKQLLAWSMASVLVVSGLVGGAGWLAFQLGQGGGSWRGMDRGQERAADRSQQEKPQDRTKGRAAWAETSEGRLAYDLARMGSLKVLARCEGPGWEVRDGKCYPQPLDGQTVFGWPIPGVTAGPTSGNQQ